MHLDILVEGIKEEVEEFEKWWQTRTIPMKYKDKDGEDKEAIIQIALRERKMFSLIFPKEALDVVMNTMSPEEHSISRFDKSGTKQWGMAIKALRMALKLKQIPSRIDKTSKLPIRPFQNTRVLALGIREDIDIKEPNGTTHEGL